MIRERLLDIGTGLSTHAAVAEEMQAHFLPTKREIKHDLSAYSAIPSLQMVDYQMRINPNNDMRYKRDRNPPFIRYSVFFDEGDGRKQRKGRVVNKIFTKEWLNSCLSRIEDLYDAETEGFGQDLGSPEMSLWGMDGAHMEGSGENHPHSAEPDTGESDAEESDAEESESQSSSSEAPDSDIPALAYDVIGRSYLEHSDGETSQYERPDVDYYDRDESDKEEVDNNDSDSGASSVGDTSKSKASSNSEASSRSEARKRKRSDLGRSEAEAESSDVERSDVESADMQGPYYEHVENSYLEGSVAEDPDEGWNMEGSEKGYEPDSD